MGDYPAEATNATGGSPRCHVKIVSALSSESLFDLWLPWQSDITHLKHSIRKERGIGFWRQRLLLPGGRLLRDRETLDRIAESSTSWRPGRRPQRRHKYNML